MIEIFLDNQPVFTSGSKELKIACENPSLTESGSYTLEIEFPLDIPQNLSVFGHISRLDVKKSQQHFAVRINVDSREVFNGSAILTGVSQESAKVQLVGGNSETNFFYKYENQYVDELPFETVNLEKIAEENGANLADKNLSREEQVERFGGVGVPKYYMRVPTYDSTNDRYLNHYKTYIQDHWEDADYNSYKTKAPSFLWVLRSVIAAMGYSVTRCEYDDTPIQYMYIAYSGAMAEPGSAIQISDAEVLHQVLPHWKVQDYISQIQDFLNCTVEFMSVGKEAHIIKNTPSSRKLQTLNVVDEFNVEISEEENDDEGTLGFKTPYYSRVDSKLKDIWEYFEHKFFNNSQEAEAYADTLSAEERERIFFETPSQTAFWDSHISGGMWRYLTELIGTWQGRKELKELKINPATFLGIDSLAGKGTVSVQMLWNEEDEYTPIWEAIDNDADYKNPHEDKEDAMYVMWVYPGQLYSGNWFDTGIPWPSGETTVYLDNTYSRSWTMDLHASALTRVFTIGDLHSTIMKPQDKVLHHFSFLSDKVPDISSIFFIRGKRYLAKKIEYSLKNDGINQLMTGEFFELES